MYFPGGMPYTPSRTPSTSYMPRPELPPHLQSLFNPKPPLPFVKVPLKPKCRPYTGLAEYVDLFDQAAPQNVDMEQQGNEIQSTAQSNSMEVEDKYARHRIQNEEGLKTWNPLQYEFDTDPFKTLFVCRLSFETNERKLRREFEIYGTIRSIKILKDSSGKSRGYAFIEYENEKDFKNAYKHADGRKIDGRRILVDFERGRTSKDWKPRRLGGGKGDTRTSRQKGQKAPRRIDLQYIYDESRGYKVTTPSRSRSREIKPVPKEDYKKDRPERVERPERTERVERLERTERTERGERSERPERGERSERPERGERTERYVRTERPERGERSDRGDRIERPPHKYKPRRDDNRPRRNSGDYARNDRRKSFQRRSDRK